MDAFFIGPNDLLKSMGKKPGWDSDDPVFVDALKHLQEVGKKYGVASGIHVANVASAIHRREEGFQFIAVASEAGMMLSKAQEMAKALDCGRIVKWLNTDQPEQTMNIHLQQDRTSSRSWFKGCSIAICWLAAMALSTLAGSVPNIILIMTDDQGYQDLGCYGSPNIQTPHLDQLAKEGMRFTDFYSGNSVCSPSRAALLTGCYPTRVHIPGVLFPKDTTGLHPNEITLAEMLKSAGYATTCIGKWHLGHHPDFPV